MIVKITKHEIAAFLNVPSVDLKKIHKMTFANKGISAKASSTLFNDAVEVEFTFSKKAKQDSYIKETLESIIEEIMMEIREALYLAEPNPSAVHA